MEKYMKVIILISIIIGASVGILGYNEAVSIGEPFVQIDVYGEEFDYIKVSNDEFTIYLAGYNLHDRESLEWVSADYQEIDVIVVINGIKYERSMFCCKGESSEFEVEGVNIKFSYYMEENVFTSRAVLLGIIVAVWFSFMVGVLLWALEGIRTMYSNRVTENVMNDIENI